MTTTTAVTTPVSTVGGTPIIQNQAGSSQTYVPPATPVTGATSTSALTLALGMTAGVGVGDATYTNPPIGSPYWDPYGGNPAWNVQRVGFLTSLQNGQAGGGSTLLFIFNPNEIDVGFSMDTGAIPPQVVMGANSGSSSAMANAAASPITNAQTVGWSLYFDRTYDMLYGPNPGGNRGVLKDVAALYAVLGAFALGGSADTGGGTSVSSVAGGYPFATACQVVFGQTDDGEIWGFTGYISQVSIEYGIFKYNMIPSKCQIDLTMTCQYVPPSPPSTTTTDSGASVPTVNNSGIIQPTGLNGQTLLGIPTP